MQDTTSIMLVTYNRLELTKRMITNFFQVTTSPYHLLVVDNGSKDGTVEFLHELDKSVPTFCQGVKFLFNPENKGIASGRNQGLKLASQFSDPFLSTLDNDVELPMGWLGDCIDIIKANPMFAVGVNMENVMYPLKTINGKTFQVKPMGNLGTACTVFPKKLHQQIGYFATDMELYSHEDADYFFRARMLDYQMGYLKEMGLHFGDGALDVGEYREWKTECSKKGYPVFQRNCYLYNSGKKSYFLPYSEK
jgi:GT2 family glycosyltransferase